MTVFEVFMQKFGLFDLIEKLLPLEKAVKNFTENKEKENSLPQKSTENNQKDMPKQNLAPYLSYVKRHDEISKRIEKNNSRK